MRDAHASTEPLRARLSPRASIVVVAIVAGVVRLWALCSTPLIITWDGGEYILAALELLENGRQVLTPYRTPGYPVLIAGAFAVFGKTPVAVLAMQHLLGWVMCVVAAWACMRLAGSRWGLAISMAMAVEPLLLCMEGHALSEAPSAALAVIGTALVLGDRRALPRTALLLGLCLGTACLVRPALQVLVPFYAVAFILRPKARLQRPVVLSVCIAAGFLAIAGPWLAYNQQRGVTGLARGGTIALWYGLSRCGLLAPPPEYVDEGVRAAFQNRLRAGESNSEAATWAFYNEVGAVTDPGVYDALTRWSRDSISARPGAYAVASLYGVLWQIDVFPRRYGFESNQEWFMVRFAQDGRRWGQDAANFTMGPGVGRLREFAMAPGSGLLHRVYRGYAGLRPEGWPQVILFMFAISGLVVGAFRRDWRLSLVCLGTLVFVASHAMLLLAQPRYGLPAWSTWYIVAAAVVGSWRRPRA